MADRVGGGPPPWGGPFWGHFGPFWGHFDHFGGGPPPQGGPGSDLGSFKTDDFGPFLGSGGGH